MPFTKTAVNTLRETTFYPRYAQPVAHAVGRPTQHISSGAARLVAWTLQSCNKLCWAHTTLSGALETTSLGIVLGLICRAHLSNYLSRRRNYYAIDVKNSNSVFGKPVLVVWGNGGWDRIELHATVSFTSSEFDLSLTRVRTVCCTTLLSEKRFLSIHFSFRAVYFYICSCV